MASLILYGSSVADSTLTTACLMAAASGGVETSKQSTYTGSSGNFGEVWSQGTAGVAAVTAIPAPTGHGWIYYPGAGTFATGNWTLVITAAYPINNNDPQTFRIYKLSGGVYTSIGQITFNDSTAAKTTYSPAAVSMASVTFAAGDGLYFDLWYQDSFGAVTDSATVYESTSATAGVTSDLQVTTSSFTASGGSVALTAEFDGVGTLTETFFLARSPLYLPFGTPRVLGGTIMPQVIKPPLIYTPRALGGTILTESRTFVPRALGGAYIPDDPTQLWVPRSLGAVLQIPLSVALSCTMSGVGTLAETLSLATSLTDTIPGVGTLTGTLSLSTALAVTMPGVGTLNETLSLATSLAGEADGIGTLTGTMSATFALAVECDGAAIFSSAPITIRFAAPVIYTPRALGGTILTDNRVFIPRTLGGVYILDTSLWVPRTLGGDLQVQPLSVTMTGVGQLLPSLATSGGVSLAVTFAGVGTLTGTLSLSTSLSTTMAGVGTLTGTLSLTTALATTIPGVGTLTGTMSLTTALSVTCAGVGTLNLSLSANLALPSTTLPGVGTLTGTLALATSLARTLPGVGTLSGVFTIRIALSLTCAGIGTLTGGLTIPSLSFLSATWVTRDGLATWITRDGKVTWNTRDEKAAWNARDEQATWETRDELALWKTRS